LFRMFAKLIMFAAASASGSQTTWPLVRASDSAICPLQIGKPGQFSIGFDQMPSIQHSAQPGRGGGSTIV
jgi:hypothetical protein